MLHFLRNIRKNLLDQNRVGRYLLYAVGEIVLLLVGILLALQINTWNTKRANDILFEKNVQQLYSSLQTDKFLLTGARAYSELQYDLIMGILINPDTLPPDLLAHTLFFLDDIVQQLNTETQFLLDNTVFDPQNEQQKALIQQITNFTTNRTTDRIYENIYIGKNYLHSHLEDNGIPIPKTFFGLFLLNEQPLDFFTKEELERVQALVQQKDFQKSLRSLASNKLTIMDMVDSDIVTMQAILSRILVSYPDTKLLYDDLGILGSALPVGWGKSIPMVISDSKKSIWEIEVALDSGSVKFRNGDNWQINWGGIEFPEGTPIYHGPNIAVEPGNYRIILNLSENRYSFEKLND